MQIESKPDACASVQGPSDLDDQAGGDGAARSQTWDPYEVWLQRVLRPRAAADAIARAAGVQLPRPGSGS